MTPPPIPPNFMGGPMRPGADGMRPPMMMPPAGTPGMPVAGPFPGPGIPGAGFPVPFRGMTPVPGMAPPGNLNYIVKSSCFECSNSDSFYIICNLVVL